jgi:retinol dehydrogenase 8
MSHWFNNISNTNYHFHIHSLLNLNVGVVEKPQQNSSVFVFIHHSLPPPPISPSFLVQTCKPTILSRGSITMDVEGVSSESKSLPIALVIGCSTGIGFSTTSEIVKTGKYEVHATRRDLSLPWPVYGGQELDKTVIVHSMDVTVEESVRSCIAEIIPPGSGKNIEVLILNAGFGLWANVESALIEEAKAMMDVNFWGVVRVMQHVLPIMRNHKSGRIVVLSSAAGIRGVPHLEFYAASKHAVEGLVESMAFEYRHLGIFVSLIEPGPVDTPFVRSSMQTGTRVPEDDPTFSSRHELCVNTLESSFLYSHEPPEIGKMIIGIVNEETPVLRYPTGNCKGVARRKFIDVTGETGIDEIGQTYYFDVSPPNAPHT